MLKKWIGACLAVVMCVTMTGCTQVMDLTDEQTRLIAEYAADLLMSHTRGYEDRLQEGEEKLSESEASSEQAAAAVDAQTSELTTEVGDGGDSAQITENAETENTQEIQDVAEILGTDGVSIRYQEYAFTDRYPEDGDEAVSVDAPEGYRLLVVRFAIRTTMDEQRQIALMDQDVKYRLVYNDQISAEPMLTILTDDLTTLETTVVPDEEKTAVLVFQISEQEQQQLDTLKLHITYDNVEGVIQIL